MSSFDIFSYYSPPQTTLSTHIHPDSVAAQLGLTPEELTPILQDQQHEYQQEELEYEAAQPPLYFTHTIHPESTAAQLGLSMEEMEEVLEDQREWMRQEEEEEQRYWEARHTTAGTPNQQDHHNDDTRPPPPPIEYDAHNTTNNEDDIFVSSFDHDEFDDGTISAEPDRDTIELVVPGISGMDWAAEVEETMGLDTQGEHTPAIYYPRP